MLQIQIRMDIWLLSFEDPDQQHLFFNKNNEIQGIFCEEYNVFSNN